MAPLFFLDTPTPFFYGKTEKECQEAFGSTIRPKSLGFNLDGPSKGEDMNRFAKYALSICLITVITVLPMISSSAMAQTVEEEKETSLAAVVVDVVAVRPLGCASTVVGLLGYVVSLPFSIPGDNDEVVWENLVEDPAAYTFKRPIGEF
jgi:hypothetical protein